MQGGTFIFNENVMFFIQNAYLCHEMSPHAVLYHHINHISIYILNQTNT